MFNDVCQYFYGFASSLMPDHNVRRCSEASKTVDYYCQGQSVAEWLGELLQQKKSAAQNQEPVKLIPLTEDPIQSGECFDVGPYRNTKYNSAWADEQVHPYY